jgi:predicted O-methyltransferase YrrM
LALLLLPSAAKEIRNPAVAANASSTCEIGAAGCGTTFLLLQAAAENATIITLDLNYTATRQAALENFALPQQRIFCLRQDSHLPETARAVKECLEGRSLDVLFLDGDHSYEGVKADFDLYSPLVGLGGVIVFHDIVPDFKTRYGFQTATDSGGVPQFWQEIKSSYPDVEELVEDYEQDGFGIGVLHWGEATSVGK